MGRLTRFIPENKDGVLVEVTARVTGARALLVPSPDPRRFNEVVVGVMGRALEVSPLELCSADEVAKLIREIEEDGEEQRDGNEVAGVERILSQNPYEPPTLRTKRSSKPLFHVASKQARDDLRAELAGFLAQYWKASEALRGGNLSAAKWFPRGCYPPALSFTGPPAPSRPPSPPTRRITILETGAVERGGIPVVEIPVVTLQAPPLQVGEPRTRGRPP